MNLEPKPFNEGYEDVQRILVGDVQQIPGMSQIAPTIHGFHKYDQRLLAMGRPLSEDHPGDIAIIADHDYDRDWVDYMANIGFGPGKSNIITTGIPDGIHPLLERIVEDEELAEHVKQEVGERQRVDTNLTPYYYSDEAIEVAGALEAGYSGTNTKTARRFNDKVLFSDFCKKHGWPVPEGTVIYKGSGDKDRLRKELMRGVLEFEHEGKTYLRGNFGASGSSSGVVRVDNIDKALEWILGDEASDKFLLEKFYPAQGSPSQTFDTQAETRPLSRLSGQVLDLENKHMGNYFERGIKPPKLKQELLERLLNLAVHAKEDGYRGIIGFDTMIVPENMAPDREFPFVMAEANARMTGASPIAYIHEQLESRHGEKIYIVSYNVEMQNMKFNELHGVLENGVLYDGEEPEGTMVPFFINNLSDAPGKSKATIVSFSTNPEKLEEIVEKTSERLEDIQAHASVTRAIR